MLPGSRTTLRFALGVIFLIVAAAALRLDAADPFAERLSQEKQVAHVLNRLAYGARPGELDEVRGRGVEAWIRTQLRPERIPQSRGLEARLKPFRSVTLFTREVFEQYTPLLAGLPPPTPLTQLLPASQVAILQRGTLEERRGILTALTGETRRQVLLVVPPEAMKDLQEIQVEAFNVRGAENERRTAEQRRLRPPLMELLTQEQLMTLMRGTDDEKMTVLNALDPEKRKQVLRQVPSGAMPLAIRREAMTLGQPAQLPLVELIDAKIYRAVYSTRQLEEVLIDFWLNHFNVFSGKGPVRMMLTSYERDAIRPHVLGRFRDMVLATARHPAMLFYLDNWQSQAQRPDAPPPPGAAGAAARRQGLNENYGRELMELHTLGVDGGYTQADVVNVARAFTGWTIDEPNRLGEFLFNPSMHDRDEKVVLGHTLPAGRGEEDGLQVIDILSRHPSTAKFIARKLAQRFVADAPPQRLVDRVAARFTKTDGDLRAVMETLLLSDEFVSEGAWQSKLKSPLELAASALRALNADVSDTMVLATRIGELGQPLYGKAEPTGYPNTGEMWASSASLLGRINFAEALTSGQMPGVKVDTTVMQSASPQTAAARLLGAPPSAGVIKALEGLPGASIEARAAVLLASPDFQKR